MNTDIYKLKKMISDSKSIVFFGGAGVSTESGIPDFRSAHGLYNTDSGFSYPPEVMLSHSFFITHTKEFFEYYKKKIVHRDAKPNAAHIALYKLEQQGKLKAVVTQNIDGLHQAAGSTNVLELHGSIYRNYCMKCGKKFDLDYVMDSKEVIPLCDECGSIVKPDVVLYEESLDMDVLNRAVQSITEADMMIVAGTSLSVYPAASMVGYYSGNKLVIINKTPTSYDTRANLLINESVGKVMAEAVDA